MGTPRIYICQQYGISAERSFRKWTEPPQKQSLNCCNWPLTRPLKSFAIPVLLLLVQGAGHGTKGFNVCPSGLWSCFNPIASYPHFYFGSRMFALCSYMLEMYNFLFDVLQEPRGDFRMGFFIDVGNVKTLGISLRWNSCILHTEMDVSFSGARDRMLWFRSTTPSKKLVFRDRSYLEVGHYGGTVRKEYLSFSFLILLYDSHGLKSFLLACPSNSPFLLWNCQTWIETVSKNKPFKISIVDMWFL